MSGETRKGCETCKWEVGGYCERPGGNDCDWEGELFQGKRNTWRDWEPKDVGSQLAYRVRKIVAYIRTHEVDEIKSTVQSSKPHTPEGTTPQASASEPQKEE